MITNYSRNKFYFILLLILSISLKSTGQFKLPAGLYNMLYPKIDFKSESLLSCDNLPNSICNYISNNDFTPLPSYFLDPTNNNHIAFVTNLVPSWIVGNGTANPYDGLVLNNPLPPPNSTGYFFGGTGYTSSFGGHISESVVQKIPKLTANNIYSLSFYKMFRDYTSSNPSSNYPLDKLKIVLMKCQDYDNTFMPWSYQVPALPFNSQTIYCETNVNNPTWNQVFIKFTANQDYDMIWIYPERNQNNTNPLIISGLLFGKPELFNISNFNAGPSPNPTAPNCIINIGPTSPNCAPVGSVFTWYGPNGQVIPALANQQIPLDASIPTNVGTWTLQMSMPNAVSTNNTCSINGGVLQASVVVPACIICPIPSISPYGQVEYYHSGGENTIPLIFTSSIQNGNQWYVDGVPVLGETNQVFNYIWVTTNAPPVETHLISVKNGNCFSASTTAKFFFYPSNCSNTQTMSNHCSPSGINTPYYVCENTSSYLQTFNLGQNATYSWIIGNLPNVNITSQSSNVAQLSIGNATGGGALEVLAKSEISGLIKYFDYHVFISDNTNTTNSGGISLPIGGISTINFLNDANYQQGFARALFNFGTASIVDVSPPPVSPYFFSGNTLYADMSTTSHVRLIRNGMTNYKVEFSNINNDDCFKRNIWVGLAAKQNNSFNIESNSIVESKGSKNEKFNSNKLNEKENLISNIKLIEIRNTIGQLNKIINLSSSIDRLIKTSKLDGLQTGLYFLKITYKNNTTETIKRFLN